MSEDTSELSLNPSENGTGKEKNQRVVELEAKINKLFAAIESGEIKGGQELFQGIVFEPIQLGFKDGQPVVDQIVLSSGKKPEDRGIEIRVNKLGGDKRYQVNIDDYRESEKVGDVSQGVQKVSGVKYSFALGRGKLFGSNKNEVLTSIGNVTEAFDGPGRGSEFTDDDLEELNELFTSLVNGV